MSELILATPLGVIVQRSRGSGRPGDAFQNFDFSLELLGPLLDAREMGERCAKPLFEAVRVRAQVHGLSSSSGTA